MLQSLVFFAVMLFIYGTVEFYGWQALKTAFQPQNLNAARMIYWGLSGTLLAFVILYRKYLYGVFPRTLASYILLLFVILILSKIIVLLFLFPEDVVRLFRTGIAKLSTTPAVAGGITRSEFLSRAALIAAAIPAGTLIYGVLVNAYNYQFRRVSIKFPNLPDAFHGFKIIQLSDIHSGSFTKTGPIEKVIKQINAAEADVVLFTGDLVNNVADEMEPFMNVFDKIKAKHGVLSITGNHDYGDYVQWDTPADKKANFKKFTDTHKNLGWDLLLNEHRILERDGQKIAIIGVENYGGGHFAKYGKFPEAYKGTEEVPFKILMSHDPSSWDNKIRHEYPETDLTLSGHTHGAQFGVENKWLKWSPSQYIYKQWAGLYNEGKQFLYVNRGFGFLFYPGRVGILPEVTEITLLKG
jgi:predicted MPP superfamily phosphohydrolase